MNHLGGGHGNNQRRNQQSADQVKHVIGEANVNLETIKLDGSVFYVLGEWDKGRKFFLAFFRQQGWVSRGGGVLRGDSWGNFRGACEEEGDGEGGG